MSRYFFYALLIIGLMGTVTGVFAQSQNQPLHLTLTLSNVQVNSYYLDVCYAYTFTGSVSVAGSWSGGPLRFEGTGYVVTDTGTNNFTIPSGDFSPQYLSHPSSTNSDFQTPECAPANATPETGNLTEPNPDHAYSVVNPDSTNP